MIGVALALLADGRPFLAAVLVFAVAIRLIGPIKLMLCIGGHSDKRGS
jgi:hypothetical protein